MIKRTCVTVLLCTVTLAVAIPVGSQAESYVSFAGEFKIDLPDGWSRSDYNTVSYYLAQSADPSQLANLGFEAVFSPADTAEIFLDREYLLLTVDTSGRLNREEIDTVLSDLAADFEIPITRGSLGDLTALQVDQGIYDRQINTVAVLTDVWEAGKIIRKSLVALRFYDKGSASFYFYAPDSVYESALPAFAQILASFNTEDLASSTSQPVEVADIEKRGTDKSVAKKWLRVGTPLLAMIVIIIAVRRRKRKSQQA